MSDAPTTHLHPRGAPRMRIGAAPMPQPRDVRRTRTQVGEVTVHAREAGSGSECVVLLHGLSGSSRWWRRNLGAFAERYRAVAPDSIGFGRTRLRSRLLGRGLPDIPGVAALLDDWMEAARIERAHVVGHSMGGQLAIHLAARFPERLGSLVLVDAAGIPRPLGPRGLLRFAREVAPPRRWGDPRFLPVIVGDALRAGPATLLRAMRHIARDDVRPLLGRIRARTLIVWGEGDRIVPPEHGREMRREIPGSRLVTLGSAAHNPMVDRPERFNRMVLRFLDGEEVGE